jgi:RNA polymerase-binding transcription factor DksA
MKLKNEIKKIKDEIFYLENNLKDFSNTCQKVQKENFLSLENDQKYLKILEKKLKNFLEKEEGGLCKKCKMKIEEKRLEILPETRFCSKCN